VVSLALLVGCNDLSDYSSGQGHYEGTVTAGTFVRAGFEDTTQLCLKLDTDRLQDVPGSIVSSDGRFVRDTALRPIPQTYHDPISSLNFGSEREKTLLYAARVKDGTDAFVFVSLMKGGSVEVRILRGAPTAAGPGDQMFGVFSMQKKRGECPF
jgi:hypothetical protein